MKITCYTVYICEHNLFVTQQKIMRLFEGDIKTDILNSTHFSISKEHFDPKTISYRIPIKSYRLFDLRLSGHFHNYQDMGKQSY